MSFIVIRKDGRMLSYHRSGKDAMRWLSSHRPEATIAELLETGYEVTKSYTAEARYANKDHSKVFEPEFSAERGSFHSALNRLLFWTHQSWEWEREQHPSPAGRSKAWERWHDVIALMQIADLTLDPQPQFNYDFGQLSPPEGRGFRLKLAVYSTPEDKLKEMVSHHV